ncbi:transposase [Luteimonas mephitis]|uniref:transposase n=1 Tax=Luteimonas mephitis TaxID=83615 RepID=UPI003A8F2BC3
MARLSRIDLPGIPQHVVQRGNNRLPCFLDDGDRLRYLQLLRESLTTAHCSLHAYVLMDNHVHLLMTPTNAGNVGRLMQRLGTNYVGLFNARHGRTGSLWEGRYKACLVDSEDYVLRCHRYIELNPVRARLTDDPATYRWSSCPAYLGQRPASSLREHPAWQGLGGNQAERQEAWRRILDEALPPEQLAEIRLYLQQQRALGRDAFKAMVEAKTRRFASARPAHRPRQKPNEAK